jgi:putative glutamine amidotransferase
MYPDTNRTVFGHKTLLYLESDMARYVSRKGILPVFIPDVADEILYEILEQLDGFVFQGGADLAPQTYGEEPILDGRWKGDVYRDQYELRIMDYAVKNNKPILAICRGCQLMNVYFGGSLHQDMLTQKPNALQHRDANIYDKIHHKIEFTKHKLLAQLYSDVPSPMVNSVHHQSIKDLGKNLDILAVCPSDGTIEAIAYTETTEGKVIGVQWHPEFSHSLGDKVVDAEKIWENFARHI